MVGDAHNQLLIRVIWIEAITIFAVQRNATTIHVF
jgi:hypothetical protein